MGEEAGRQARAPEGPEQRESCPGKGCEHTGMDDMKPENPRGNRLLPLQSTKVRRSARDVAYSMRLQLTIPYCMFAGY